MSRRNKWTLRTVKIVLLCNSPIALPTLDAMACKGSLAGLVLPERRHSTIGHAAKIANDHARPVIRVNRANLAEKLGPWLEDLSPDAGFILTFPYRLPASILAIPKRGFFNFHFGLLPEYRGSDPIFWQLRRGEEHGGITLHAVDENLDTGPVWDNSLLRIIPGETYGMHLGKLGNQAASLADRFLSTLESGEELELTPQDAKTARTYSRPKRRELEIDWDRDSADEIERLVNAANPEYGGAATVFRGVETRLLEVAPADFPDRPPLPAFTNSLSR